MTRPTTELSREASEEIDEDAVEGILSFASRCSWFEKTAPHRIGISGVHHYLSHSKPSDFHLEDIFVFAELENHIFSKHEIRDMVKRVSTEADQEMPVVEELLDTGVFVKNALGFVFQPQVPNGEEFQGKLSDWVGGAVVYKQPSDRMIGPDLQDLSPYEFGKQFTDEGEVLVFQPSNRRLRQLLAGIELTADL